MVRLAGIALFVLSICLLTVGCGDPNVDTQNDSPAGEGGESETHPIAEEEQPQPEIPQPEPGETLPWIDGSLLVYIPPGEFLMGDGDSGDHPEHMVFLDGFWIYRTEVTYNMYLNCMASGRCSPPVEDASIPDIEDPELAHLPMVNVRWHQAAQYCEWMGGFLPTEAQWEKAARGFESFPYPWGDEYPNCELLNFDNCLGETTTVHTYAESASPFEVYDTAGNILEWVADWYHEEYYYMSPFDNPGGPEGGEERVVRSSNYLSGPEQIPLFLRNAGHPDDYRPDLGFRCVVARAHEYAPPCEVLAYVPPGGGENPDDPPGGSAECIVQVPDITWTSYCHEGERRNNISWTPADADIDYSTLEGAWCQGYDADTIICGGPTGAMVDIEACKSCPAPVVDLGVMGTCDKPYTLDDVSGYCRYAGPPVLPKERCAPGFSLNADAACCEMVNRTPLDFPVCAVGGKFDPQSRICWFRLPSTGDLECDKQRVYFDACKKEGGSGDGGGRPGACGQYGNESACESNGCYWWCYTTSDGLICNCITPP
jgi:formylglycine-generating enzyme required for sulfatase activity